jgi:hypothetical protein
MYLYVNDKHSSLFFHSDSDEGNPVHKQTYQVYIIFNSAVLIGPTTAKGSYKRFIFIQNIEMKSIKTEKNVRGNL